MKAFLRQPPLWFILLGLVSSLTAVVLSGAMLLGWKP